MGLKQKSAVFVKENLESLAHLLFPNSCLICSTELTRKEKKICISCLGDLPETKFSPEDLDNPAQQLFWGRVEIENVFCWLNYSKDLSTKTLLHHIKYRDKPQLAQIMGEEIGKNLAETEWIKTVDALVPVPIHPKKKFIRGYNQSEQIGIGLSTVLSIPLDLHFLKRALHTESQTKKGRFGRWDNIEHAFLLKKNNRDYAHIAIVDDVITTGATMEQIVLQIKEKNPDLRVSLISLALAQ